MKTLIIYDNAGYIYLQTSGTENRIPNGRINYLEIEIPSGKQAINVDITVTPNIPIFEDIPLSETELLKKRIEEQEAALVELASLIGGTV